MAVIRSIPSRTEQLAIEPQIDAQDRADLAAGAALFDQREFWEAHERWEGIWQREERSVRSFYQGLIQVAAGYHHWTVTHRPKGVQLGIAKGVEKLNWYLPSYLGVDLEEFVADAQRLSAQADGRDAAWLAAFPPQQLPPFPWLDSPWRNGPWLDRSRLAGQSPPDSRRP